MEKEQEISDTLSDFCQPQDLEPTMKKRGRKREKDEEYFDRAMKKIEDIKSRLSTAKQDGMAVKER